MPLTNVWTRDHTGEWVRTTASAMDREYKYSVSANSHIFRCYYCFQYVTFIKGNAYLVSHFKHSRGEENKDCEDRSTGTGGYTYGADITDVPDPMRIRFDGSRAILEIGFFPVPAAAIETAVQLGTMIRIRGNQGAPDVYRVDRTRFEPHSMTWLQLPFSWAQKYAVEIEPRDRSILTWEIHRTPIKKSGTVFDAVTGRRIPEKSDISVGRDYYILCDRWKWFTPRGGIKLSEKIYGCEQWVVYRMTIPEYNESASDFCFDEFKLRLTMQPSDIQLLWPPAVENEDVIDTNRKHLYMYVKGESDFETYPSYGTRSKNISGINKNERIIELNVVNTLQMVSATRSSQRLKFLYIRPWVMETEYREPALQILDDKGHEVPDESAAVPPRGILRILSEVDATAEVEDREGFVYHLNIMAGEETRLQDLKRGMRIVIRQGLEKIRSIRIGGNAKKHEISSENSLALWNGRMVPMPKRYAWVLTKMDKSGELYRRTAKALTDGEIPLDGLMQISKIVGGMQHG